MQGAKVIIHMIGTSGIFQLLENCLKKSSKDTSNLKPEAFMLEMIDTKQN